MLRFTAFLALLFAIVITTNTRAHAQRRPDASIVIVADWVKDIDVFRFLADQQIRRQAAEHQLQALSNAPSTAPKPPLRSLFSPPTPNQEEPDSNVFKPLLRLDSLSLKLTPTFSSDFTTQLAEDYTGNETSKRSAKALLASIKAMDYTKRIIEDGNWPKHPTSDESAKIATYLAKKGAISELQQYCRPSALTSLSCHGTWNFPGAAIVEDWNSICSPSSGLQSAVKAVGKITLRSPVVGVTRTTATGFLVASDLIMTNRHVIVENFPNGSSFASIEVNTGKYRISDGCTGTIDFDEEECGSSSVLASITEVVAVDDRLDMAILRINLNDSNIHPISFQRSPVVMSQSNHYVAVIGFPDEVDDNQDEIARANLLYGAVLGKKRIAPGELKPTRPLPNNNFLPIPPLCHDCSTLPGNSGSPVIDLQTDRVIGLHFEGDVKPYEERIANLAVPVTAFVNNEVLSKAGVHLIWEE